MTFSLQEALCVAILELSSATMGASKPADEHAVCPNTPAAKSKDQHPFAANGGHQSGVLLPSNFASIVGVVGYATVGMAMGFSNKAVLMYFPFSNLLLMLQMVTAVVVVSALSYFGIIFVRPLELAHARRLFPLVFLYNANVCFALAGLKILNIPMYNCLKRLTPVTVLIVKRLAGSPWPPKQVVFSVLTVVGGCVIAGLGDLTFDMVGYMLALTSCILHACYLVVVETSGGEKGFSSSELLVYNALLSLPVLVPLTFLTGEFQAAQALLMHQTDTPLSGSFLSFIAVSLVMGVLLNYIIFLCTMANSALTTTIVGALRSVFSTVLGFFVLGGVEVSFLNVSGIALNTVGGLWYTGAKYTMKKKKGGSGRRPEDVIPADGSFSSPQKVIDVEEGKPLLQGS